MTREERLARMEVEEEGPDHCDRVGPTLAAAKGKVPGGSPTEVDGSHLQGYSRRRGDPARAWTSRSIVVAERVSACPTV